jgi:hypothetical protein
MGIVLSLTTVQTAFSQTMRLEAENYIDSYNIDGADIYIRGCSAASEGLAVDGLDREGEWIQLALVLTEGFCFVDSVRSAGSLGAVRTYSIQFEKTAVLWAADTLTTVPGAGITWSSAAYDWVQSYETHCLTPGNYRVTIIRLGADGATRFDCIDLAERAPLTVAARSTTWGKIKALYMTQGGRQ